MSRPIKFRAWDKAYKAMCYSPTGAEHLVGWLKAPDVFEVMQYTGLKDRNGVDVYEGDVLTNYGVTNDMKQRAFKVVWTRQRARFSMRDERSNLNTGVDDWDVGRCAVIGNVYENADLLKAVS